MASERAGIAPERCLFAGDFPIQPDEHWIDRWLRFGEFTPTAFRSGRISLRPYQGPRSPQLLVTDADREDLRRWLRKRDLTEKRLILLQPGNKRTYKRGRLGRWGDDKAWPIERWSALIQQLAERTADCAFLLCGAPSELALLKSIQRAAALDGVHVAADDLPLRRLFALLEEGYGMISVDTGPAHAAAALGCPLVVLFGAAHRAHWLPRAPSSNIVVALGGHPLSSRVADIALPDVVAAWESLHVYRRVGST